MFQFENSGSVLNRIGNRQVLKTENPGYFAAIEVTHTACVGSGIAGNER